MELQETRTDDTTIVFWAKGIQQTSKGIVLLSAAYDFREKKPVIPIQEMKREYMKMLQQKNVRS